MNLWIPNNVRFILIASNLLIRGRRRFDLLKCGAVCLVFLICLSIVAFNKGPGLEQMRDRSLPVSVQTTERLIEGQVKRLNHEELQALLRDEFQGILALDDRGYMYPNHVIGDFNNDNVKDVAILVRPSKSLKSDDASKPDFWLNAVHWGSSKFQNARGRKNREKLYYQSTLGELAMHRNLLVPIIAIIHGTPGKLWNSSKATQKFVVLGGINGTSDRMGLYRGTLHPRPIGDIGIIPPPKLIGDALLFTSAGLGTVVYWDAGDYYWYPFEPKNVESEKFLRLGEPPQCRMSHLKEWVNELPINKKSNPPTNLFQLPEVQFRLVWLLDVEGYKRLLRSFEVSSPITIIDDFLAMKGALVKEDSREVLEESVVAIRLNDPEGLCTICVGVSGKVTGRDKDIQPKWDCMRGDSLRGTKDLLPTRILAMLNKL